MATLSALSTLAGPLASTYLCL